MSLMQQADTCGGGGVTEGGSSSETGSEHRDTAQDQTRSEQNSVSILLVVCQVINYIIGFNCLTGIFIYVKASYVLYIEQK